jgi:hypothetical protein
VSDEPRRSGVVTAATLGLAVSGPVTLLSGIITFVTIPSGIAPAVATIFVLSLGVTVLSVALYLAHDIRRR